MGTGMHLRFAVVLCCLASGAGCHRDPPRSGTPQPAASAARPDWRGVWSAYPNVFDGAYDPFKPPDGPPPPGMVPPYKPQYMAQFQKNFQTFLARKPIKGLNNGMFCKPPGVLGFMLGIYPMQIVIGPDVVVVLTELDNQYRLIFTDGRPHRADADPTYRGDSIGHWEGDTLVVETTNLRTDTSLDGLGEIHSDQARVIERIRRVDARFMEIDTSVEDPVMLTAPWIIKHTYELKQDWYLQDYNCHENDRNAIDSEGREVTTLKPKG
jgi:hypothetical protein